MPSLLTPLSARRGAHPNQDLRRYTVVAARERTHGVNRAATARRASRFPARTRQLTPQASRENTIDGRATVVAEGCIAQRLNDRGRAVLSGATRATCRPTGLGRREARQSAK